MKVQRWIGLGAVIATVIALVAVTDKPTQALPTFAKAYGVNCDACHTAVPQLNAYGRYVQRTGYAALDREVLNQQIPLTLAEGAIGDTRSPTSPGKTEFGNTALHMAGFVAPDFTYHVHQWITQNGQPGGLDTMQLSYNNLFKHNAHLLVGKLSNLPVPGPFSNGSDLVPFATAELTVGEHMYQLDMMRWGAELSYVRPTFFVQTAWLGSNQDLNGATDFSASNEKTFQWITGLASPEKPLEFGAFGSTGSFPLAEGGIDRYHSEALYLQSDPQSHIPGVFAVYQWGYDGNPGIPVSSGMNASMNAPMMMPLPPANSRAWLAEAYQSFFKGRALIGLRRETTDDGLGTITHSGNIDLAIQPLHDYPYLHTYFEAGLNQGMGPAWRWMLWWTTPVGGKP